MFIYILDPENFDREKYIYIRHFEICYLILRTQIHHMLCIYAKVATRRPNPTAYGHMDMDRFKMADIYIYYIYIIYIYINY